MLAAPEKSRFLHRIVEFEAHHRVTVALAVAAFAGLFGAALLLHSAKQLDDTEAIWHVALAVLTVVASWLLIHTVMSLHYAHMCYQILPCCCDSTAELHPAQAQRV